MGAIGKCSPKFQCEPTDPSPLDTSMPTLHHCEVIDGALHLPEQTRKFYLADPVRAQAWKVILKEFDRKWAVNPDGSAPKPPARELAKETSGDGEGEKTPPFPSEPTTKTEFESKYSQMHSFSMGQTLQAVIVEGPKLFLVSNGENRLGTDAPCLCYGGGTWLLDTKAQQFLQDWAMVALLLGFQIICAGQQRQGLSLQDG